MLLKLDGFNTVNGIRVHAMALYDMYSKKVYVKFQYRKRYKGACNFGCIPGREYNITRCFNTVNGIRVHAI